jgi:hypothetical protein
LRCSEEARGINDADFGEVQLTIGDTVITDTADKRPYVLAALNVIFILQKHITSIVIKEVPL